MKHPPRAPLHVTVTTEHHFVRAPDGRVFSETGGREYRFWTRYLSAFDEVRVVGRVRAVETPAPDGSRADGPGVRVLALPAYRGAVQYVAHRAALSRVAASVIGRGAFVLRVPGQVGSLIWSGLRRRGLPYAVEVVGDPRGVFARGAVRSILRLPARIVWDRNLRAQCRGATAAAYVTRTALQRRYAAGPATTEYHVPEVDLPPDAFVDSPRRPPPGAPRLISVGSLAQMYKGPDVLLRALAILARAGRSFVASWVGDGAHRPAMESLARSLGLQQSVRFVGQVGSVADVRRYLDAADLFVLPSRTEGLPRALLEAMARGMPCVASRVGGVPELLDDEALVRPGHANDLARTLEALLDSPSTFDRLAASNLARSRAYSDAERAAVFAEFLLRVRSMSDHGNAPPRSTGEEGWAGGR